VKVGILAPVALLEARAEAARRQEAVITATNSLDLARKRLRHILNLNPRGAFIPRAVEPTDLPRVEPLPIERSAVLTRAIKRRPQLARARLDAQTQKMRVRLAENQLLPQLDVQVRWGLNGLSGRAKSVEVTDPTTGQVTRVKSAFDGDFENALDALFDDRFYQFFAGLTLEVPLGNSAAKAEYTQRKIDLARAVLTYQDLLSQVTLEVEEAIGNVETALKRIQATQLARELAEENLKNQQGRFAVGLATTTDILDFQEDLTAARDAEIQAMIDYNLALARLKRADWTLLDDYHIILEVGK
jgi:outer membrane protein TolC